jgi:hypothetical protein
MQAYRFYTTTAESGQIVLTGLPFPAGVQVEVLVIADTPSRAELVKDWTESCRRIQGLPHLQDLTDEDIAAEINAYRSGV